MAIIIGTLGGKSPEGYLILLNPKRVEGNGVQTIIRTHANLRPVDFANSFRAIGKIQQGAIVRLTCDVAQYPGPRGEAKVGFNSITKMERL